MPAVSKDQQRAAGIALSAKKDGTTGDLPKGSASANMAKSMSADELKDFASTKHKGLPKEKNESKAFSLTEMHNGVLREGLPKPRDNASVPPSGYSKNEEQEEREEIASKYRTPDSRGDPRDLEEQWEKALMVQEEMIGTDDADGQITTDKSKPERISDEDKKEAENKKAHNHTVSGIAHASGRSNPTNTAGAARVAHNEHKTFNPNSLDLLFEHDPGADSDVAKRTAEWIRRKKINNEETARDFIKDILDGIQNGSITLSDEFLDATMGQADLEAEQDDIENLVTSMDVGARPYENYVHESLSTERWQKNAGIKKNPK